MNSNDNKKIPLVSVIVPVFNVEEYIDKCLSSITGQTYSNIEIIVVYAASNDNSRQKCEAFAATDSRIKIIDQHSKGLGFARNEGVDDSIGEWICYVDSDDFISEKYVERLLYFAIEHNCLTVRCRFNEFTNEDDITLNPVEDGDFAVDSYQKYFIYTHKHMRDGHSPYGAWCNIYHRSLLENNQFGNYRFAEDSEFTARVIYEASSAPLGIINEELYFYRQREGSMLHSGATLSRVDRFYAKKKVMDLWKELGDEVMYSLFFPDYYFCLMLDYMDLCMELPDKYEEYKFLKDEIIKCLKEDRHHMGFDVYSKSSIHPHSKELWEELVALRDTEFIVYGYGRRGKELLRQLLHFGIKPVEIWDKQFEETFSIDGIKCCIAHSDMPKNTNIVILVDNYYLDHEIRLQLLELGYSNVLMYSSVTEALKYGRYITYLPEMLRNYEGLADV